MVAVMEEPEPVRRVDRYLATARIAQEAIWELHNRLVAAGKYDEHARQQLHEAARIVAVEMPTILRRAVELRARWSDEELLDTGAAESTATELAVELDRVQPALERLRERQNAVAREFGGLLNRPP